MYRIFLEEYLELSGLRGLRGLRELRHGLALS
jgi:hypothetical protein